MNEEDKQYKEQMKKTGEKLNNAAEDKAKKEMIKKIIKIIGFKGIAITVVVILLSSFLGVVFFAGAVYYNDDDRNSKAVNAKQDAFGNDVLGETLELEGEKYKIKDYNGKTGTEAIEARLEDSGMNFEDFNQEEIECLYNCLKAEWATTYPNLGGENDNKDLDSEYVQGVITVKRGKSGGDEKEIVSLRYEPYESFNQLVLSNNDEALKCFSIDEEGNLIVASWNSRETEYTITGNMPEEIKSIYVNSGEQISITETAIDYRSMIGIHTMPFEFLLALLVNTEDIDFVNELTDLAFNSTIEITVYDNMTEIISVQEELTTEITTYIKEAKWVKWKKITKKDADGEVVSVNQGWIDRGNLIVESSDKDKVEYTINTTTITKSNSYTIALSQVDSWLSKIVNEYTYSPTSQNEDFGEGEPYEYEIKFDPETIDNKDSELQSELQKISNTDTSSSEPVTDDEGITTETTYSYNLNNATRTGTLNGTKKITKNTSQTNKYSYESTTKETLNIGKNFKEVYDKHSKAQAQLNSVSSWLFELLEETESSVDYVSVMKYLLNICTGENFGVSAEDMESLLQVMEVSTYSTMGNISAFGCTITREQFISAVKEYKKDNNTYQSKMVAYAGDFYDVCTKYNVNPVIAYAHACIETGHGSSIPYNNYFGMAIYNGQASGTRYSTPKESIEDYCKWIINNATIGTSAYAANLERAEKWAKYNEKLAGTPDNNIYALYCRYAYLGDTHLCDEPDFNNPKGTQYYLDNGSTWGGGGRVHIYEMYEKGGLYNGRYKELCGHKNANDPTSEQEKADYIVYVINTRVEIIEQIFGSSILDSQIYVDTRGLPEYNAIILEKTLWLEQKLNDNNFKYHDMISLGSNRNNHPIFNSDGTLTGKVNFGGISCASFVTEVLCQAGLYDGGKTIWAWRDAATMIPRFASFGITVKEVTPQEALPGDLIFFKNEIHVNILTKKTATTFEKTGSPEFYAPSNTNRHYKEANINQLNNWVILRVVGVK